MHTQSPVEPGGGKLAKTTHPTPRVLGPSEGVPSFRAIASFSSSRSDSVYS